jgi:hypothetical protein
MFSRPFSCLAVGAILYTLVLAAPVKGTTGRTVDHHHIEGNGPDSAGVPVRPADRSRFYLIGAGTSGVKIADGIRPVRAEDSTNIRSGMLDDIAVRESADKGVVSFSTNGIVEYEVYISTGSHRKWINIVFPGITTRLPDLLAGGERIIGQIHLEKNKEGKSVKVSVEILPLKTGYGLFHQDDSLILKVTRK